jgi:cupin fold WbuC family metalloprotein
LENISDKYYKKNEEVFYVNETVAGCDNSDIATLKTMAGNNSRQRIRLCTHNNEANLLHEMLIVHDFGTYVRPHKHIGKSESIHIIEGLVDLVIFDNDGTVCRTVRLGDYASGHLFYFRMEAPIFHTLIIRSATLVFHETTNGPFDRAETIFAPWSPIETDDLSVVEFIGNLEKKIKSI